MGSSLAINLEASSADEDTSFISISSNGSAGLPRRIISSHDLQLSVCDMEEALGEGSVLTSSPDFV